MFKIVLINMPFAEINYPSLGLTQLKSVIDDKFKDLCETKILYLNHDFAMQFGLENYNEIVKDPTLQKASLNRERFNANVGDWLFRKSAFPEINDNQNEYFLKYFSKRHSYVDFLCEKRNKIDNFLMKMIEKYNLLNANIIGFTSMFQQQLASISMARMIKKCDINIITIAGGCNFEYPASEVFAKNVPCFDYIFSGPSLISIEKFLQCVFAKNFSEIEMIPGVFTSKSATMDNKLPPSNYGEEKDINDVIDLNYSDFFESINNHFTRNQIDPELFFETSRGCWWGEKSKCTFCDYNGLSTSYRCMNESKAEIYLDKLMKHSKATKRFRSVDSIFPKDYFSKLLLKINKDKKAKIFYEVKVGHNRDEIKQLSDAGVNYIQAGIESLCSSNLKLMKKGTTCFQNIQFLKDCDLYGISILWNLLTGIPNENLECYQMYIENIPFLHHLPPPTGLWPISYDRYCDYVINRQKYNLKLKPDIDQLKFLYPFSDDELEKIAYFYINVENDKLFSFQRMKKIQQINNLIINWQNAWNRSNLPAALFYETQNNVKVIIDTRTENKNQYILNNLEYQLLNHFEHAQTIGSLQDKYSEIDAYLILDRIKFFIEQGFLFRENEQLISLILSEKPRRIVGKY